MRFFGYNYGSLIYGGTVVTVPSNNSNNSFDENQKNLWISSGYSNDGQLIYIRRDLTSSSFTTPAIKYIMLANTNFDNIKLYYNNGGIYQLLNTTQYTSEDGRTHLFEIITIGGILNNIQVTADRTTNPNNEKEIGNIYLFEDIGSLNIPPSDIKPKYNKTQIKHKLENGKDFIINKGGSLWEISFKFKAHVGSGDVELLDILMERNDPFFIWLNDNNDDIMRQKISPFKFAEVKKVLIDKGNNPSFYKNLFFSGFNDAIKFIEVD